MLTGVSQQFAADEFDISARLWMLVGRRMHLHPGPRASGLPGIPEKIKKASGLPAFLVHDLACGASRSPGFPSMISFFPTTPPSSKIHRNFDFGDVMSSFFSSDSSRPPSLARLPDAAVRGLRASPGFPINFHFLACALPHLERFRGLLAAPGFLH